MRYTTSNEWNHFVFSEAHVEEVRLVNGFVQFKLDDVMILPENSQNRDIRKMRCNGLVLHIENGKVLQLQKEGYTFYDADGKFLRKEADTKIPTEQYGQIAEVLADGYVVSMEQKAWNGEWMYLVAIDGVDENTYEVTVTGSGDREEWDRFLNLE